MLSKEKKKKLIEDFKKHPGDTGSACVQIALMTERINQLSEEHFKKNPKDHGSKRGLLGIVSKRRQLLTYLKKNDYKVYSELIEKLNIRK
ncbi:MAG: 30S ribosomal protein S15 [Elusimicrobia bacterium ADurb.Bin231]|nr:MAG: 30S ribosomal protein S15 [Elusimicrobia bacterium ADurb.Bin231]